VTAFVCPTSFLRRIGEHDKALSQDEKYSKRLRVVRKRLNKRASKFSLDNEAADLTHFGKRINEMSKTELRNSFVGSDDEKNDEPFSYDGLIAKSKEERAAARRQKMETEAELEDLDGSFMGMVSLLERRDVDADKLANGTFNEDDDLAAMARSFQMDNIRKAQAGDRTLTEREKIEQLNALIRKSAEARSAAAVDDEGENDAEDDDDVLVESDIDDEDGEPEQEETSTESSPNSLLSLMNRFLEHPEEILSLRHQLLEVARVTPAGEIATFFKDNLFEVVKGDMSLTKKEILLIKLVTILFPLDHLRHSIVVPTTKILENVCLNDPNASVCHLSLLSEFLIKGSKYSPAFLSLAGRLYRGSQLDDIKQSVMSITALFCGAFTRESLSGPLIHFFPEFFTLIPNCEEPFVPLRLHHFKPVEVLSLEPAFHEDGTEWNGQHREIREAKRMERQFKQEKKLTVKEMRREAVATESFHAIQKKRENEKAELARKRTESKMQQAEQNWRLTKTDQGKQDNRKMKSHKRPRRGGAGGK
jgi:hypothetical protein